MDMSLDAAIARHCRRVLTVTGNKKSACKMLGVSYHTLNKYLAKSTPEIADVPALDDPAESPAQQLLRLNASISNCLLRCAALLPENLEDATTKSRKR